MAIALVNQTLIGGITGSGSPPQCGNSAAIGNTSGNALVAVIGWNANAQGGTGNGAPVPVPHVTDSVGNWWIPLATSTATGVGSRCSIWIAPNAQATRWLSVCFTGYVGTAIATIGEFSGMSAYAVPDVSFTNFSASGTALTLSATATAADFAFSMMCCGTAAAPPASITGPGGLWNTFGYDTTGSTENGFIMQGGYGTFSSGGISATYTASASGALSGVLVTVNQTASAPVQPNPNWPAVKVEAAFGYSPGDITSATSPVSWTDITARAISKTGEMRISYTRGRAYELAQPEAGELTIGLRNNDGAFTPGNASSPYYPNIVLNTPVRISATWQGITYPVAFGYAERWPQEWPDSPQFGLSPAVFTDGIGIMNAVTMPSAVAGEVLADVPYAYFPGSEQYTTTSNSLNATKVTASAAGMLMANAARTNQRPGYYQDGSSQQLVTGSALNLMGDQGTGFGVSSYPSTPQTFNGPGATYYDPSMPNPGSSSGVSLEFWCLVPSLAGSGANQLGIIAVDGVPSTYTSATDRLLLVLFATQAQLFYGTGTHTVGYAPSAVPQHFVITINGTAVQLFINGILRTSFTASTVPQDWTVLRMGSTRYSFGSINLANNYAMGQVSQYPYVLSAARVMQHYLSGSSGLAGQIPANRFQSILNWAGIGLKRGGPVGVTDNMLTGAAYSVAGSTATSACNDLAQSSGCFIFGNANGEVIMLPRPALYNIPATVTFGDNAGEVPFLRGEAFDYDNTYLYNVVSSQRTNGPSTYTNVYGANQASEKAYFARTALSQPVSSTTDQDAYDRVNWSLNKYAQPSLRTRQLTVQPSSNPALWPAVLGTDVANVATVNRRPRGGAAISIPVMVQHVQGDIGADEWRVTYTLTPYVPENAVLQTDTAAFNVVGNNSLAW